MNTLDFRKTNLVAPVITLPPPRTEATIPPTPNSVRRALPSDAVAGMSIASHSVVSTPFGRWDSARAIAREQFTGLNPSKAAATPNLTQLELHFA